MELTITIESSTIQDIIEIIGLQTFYRATKILKKKIDMDK